MFLSFIFLKPFTCFKSSRDLKSPCFLRKLTIAFALALVMPFTFIKSLAVAVLMFTFASVASVVAVVVVFSAVVVAAGALAAGALVASAAKTTVAKPIAATAAIIEQ